MRTSEHLTPGQTYSRKQLMEAFKIGDSTINNGIFRPAGHDSVWIFITQNKTADRTQYVDVYSGDVLNFEGQTTGRTDDLIREHRERGLELLLFFRRKKDERPDYSFCFEGVFEYVSSESGPPTRFRLLRRA